MKKLLLLLSLLLVPACGDESIPEEDCMAVSLTQGPNFGSSAVIDPTIGTVNWFNTGDVFANDGANASVAAPASATSKYLDVTGYGFTLPANSVVRGIEVIVRALRDTGGTSSINSVKLVVGGVISGDEKAAGQALTTSSTDYTFGGPTDNWGISPLLLAAQINNSGFGAGVSLNQLTGAPASRVDSVKIKVYYCLLSDLSE